MPFHLLVEHPHFALFVQYINNGALNIIFRQQTFDHHFTLQRRNIQQTQSLFILSPVVSKKDSKYLRFNVPNICALMLN